MNNEKIYHTLWALLTTHNKEVTMDTTIEWWESYLGNEYGIQANLLKGWDEDYIPYELFTREEDAYENKQMAFVEEVNTGSMTKSEFLKTCKTYFELLNNVTFKTNF